jgi:predicted nucleic acid-binding protein
VAGQRVVAGGTLVLDSEGVSKLTAGDARARAYLDSARVRRAQVAMSGITLTETLRGGPRDATVHRVLSRITVVPVTAQIARPSW